MAFTKRTSGVVVIPRRDQPRAVCQFIRAFVCGQPMLYEKVYHNVTIPITPQVERKRIKKAIRVSYLPTILVFLYEPNGASQP